jgi:hypothetical protein
VAGHAFCKGDLAAYNKQTFRMIMTKADAKKMGLGK